MVESIYNFKKPKPNKNVAKPYKGASCSTFFFIFVTVIIGFVFGVIGSLSALIFIFPKLADNPAFQSLFSKGEVGETVIKTVERVELEENSAVHDAINKAKKSVVAIVPRKNLSSLYANPFDQKEIGTGFFISADGYLITDSSWISNKSFNYTAIEENGTVHDLEFVAEDEFLGLSFLKTKADNLHVPNLGSSSLDPSQKIIALGSKFSSKDVVSISTSVKSINKGLTATDSVSVYDKAYIEDLILPGDEFESHLKGGPVLNIRGEVVGIASKVDFAGHEKSIVLPADIVKKSIESVLEKGEFSRVRLGVHYIMLSPELCEINKIENKNGAILTPAPEYSILSVSKTSPLFNLGLSDKDIILKFGSFDLNSETTLFDALQNYKTGDEVEVKYIKNGAEETASIQLK